MKSQIIQKLQPLVNQATDALKKGKANSFFVDKIEIRWIKDDFICLYFYLSGGDKKSWITYLVNWSVPREKGLEMMVTKYGWPDYLSNPYLIDLLKAIMADIWACYLSLRKAS